MQLTEMPGICTLVNIAVLESAEQTDSQTLDEEMPKRNTAI